jgi:hypothetical protein
MGPPMHAPCSSACGVNATSVNPVYWAAPAPHVESKPPSDLTPKLVVRVRALYEELGRQDVLAVQEFEQAQKTSKEKAVQ